MRKENNLIRGIAAIGVMVIIVVLAVAVTIAVPLFIQNNQVDKVNITKNKLIKIKEAIIGNPEKMVERSRASFGFVGDIGILPDNLMQLRTGSGLPPFQLQNNVWFGYRGPYLKSDSDLKDAWGNDIIYTVSSISGVLSIDIRSNGNPDIADDDIFESIRETDFQNYVSGKIINKVSKSIKTDYTGPMDVYYPDGTNNLALKTIQISSGVFDSLNETEKFPIGNRYFQTQDMEYKKLVSLNGGGNSIISFFGDESNVISGELFERTFSATDNIADNGITSARGTWASSNGDFFATGKGEHRAFFGNVNWKNYRIEVDATLIEGRGYGIYYRTNGQRDVTGYILQFDPGLYSGGMEFVIRKVVNGNENYFPYAKRFLIRKRYTTAEFEVLFNGSITGDQHHISITLLEDRHIIKVDGVKIIDVTDTEPLFPCGGLCGNAGFRSWEGRSKTAFHSLKVYDIPPLSTGELVWWSFEEGNGDRVYGSGFEIGADEINGTLVDGVHIQRKWEDTNKHGNAVYLDGSKNGHINFGDVSSMNFSPNDAFTISAWVRIDNNKGKRVIISKMSGEQGWNLRIRDNKNPPKNYGVEFSLRQSPNSREIKIVNSVEVEVGHWYHIAVTYDGTEYSGNELIPTSAVQIYVTREDELNVSTPPMSTRVNTLRADHITINSGNFNMGTRRDGKDPFSGYIDEIRIYKKALIFPEIEKLFQKDK